MMQGASHPQSMTVSRSRLGFAANGDVPVRYAALDAWRGICACLVTLVHVPIAHAWYGETLFTNMQLFVDFFFVLSGFVICHAYAARIETARGAGGFMIRRFGRIWPLHAAVLAGFVIFEILKIGVDKGLGLSLDGEAFSGNRSLESLVTNLALVQSFNLHGMTTWNGPAWSIGVEFYTYAVFALCVLVLGARPLVFAGLAGIGLAGVVWGSEAWLFTTHDYGFFRCLFGFFSGCLVYGWVAHGRPPAWTGSAIGTAAEVAAVALLVAFLALTGRSASSLLAPAVFGVLVYVFAFEGGALSRLLLRRFPQNLGLWSYSIYMVHMLLFAPMKVALSLAAKLSIFGVALVAGEPVKLWSFGQTWLDFVAVAAAIAASVVVARWTFRWIEEPARAAFSGIAGRFENRASGTAGPATVKPAQQIIA